MPESRDSVQDIWGERTPFRGQGKWPERLDYRVREEPEQWIQSACVLCSNGCGIDIGVKQGRIVGVRGRATDAVNKGRLGPKGLNGWEANHSPDRLTSPLIRKQGSLHEATWDEGDGPDRASDPRHTWALYSKRDWLLHHRPAFP